MFGKSGLTTVRENGVLYTLDVTKCMFASGNGTERCATLSKGLIPRTSTILSIIHMRIITLMHTTCILFTLRRCTGTSLRLPPHPILL